MHFPELALCTDNGAMIALAAAMRLQRGIAALSTDYAFDVLPRWPLTSSSQRSLGPAETGPAARPSPDQAMLSCVAPAGTFLASVSVRTPFSNFACDCAWSTSAGSTTVRA